MLPSRLPGEVRIDSPSTSYSVHTSDRVRVVDGASQTDQGVISGAESSVARYDGQIKAIRTEEGGQVEFDERSRRIICTAPSDRSSTFIFEAEEALVYEREAHADLEVQVDAGETERVKYYGNSFSIAIDDLHVDFNDNQYPEAVTSTKLQSAAAVERTEIFSRLDEEVDGRIRHDAAGLHSFSSSSEGQYQDSVSYLLTDTASNNRSTISLTKQRDTDRVTAGSYVIEDFGTEGQPGEATINTLDGDAQALGAHGELQFDTKTVEIPASAGVTRSSATNVSSTANEGSSELIDTSGDSPEYMGITTQYFGAWDFIRDNLSTLRSLADDIGTGYYNLGKALWATVKDHASDIAIAAGNITVDTVLALQSLATNTLKKLGVGIAGRLAWAVKVSGFSSLLSFTQAGGFEAIKNDNYACASCVLFVSIMIDVVACGIAPGAICTGIGSLTFVAGGVACAFAVSVICSAIAEGGRLALGDAKDLCGAASEYTSLGEIC